MVRVPKKMYNLEGKVAIVTGASRRRGIGRAIAMRLAAEGADLVLMDICRNLSRSSGTQSSRAELEELAHDIEDLGRKTLTVVGNVSESEDVDHLVQKTLEHYGHIDILINNAGISGPQVMVTDISEEEWDEVFLVNIKGVFLCSRAVAKEMIRQRLRGKIVNIASQAGKRGFVLKAAYCASKFAVIGLTQVMALELARYNINVNAVCPGTVDTEMIDHMFRELSRISKRSPEEVKQRIIKHEIPLGRLERPEEVASLVVWLTSKQADYMTGESINITGGQTMD